MDLRRIFMEETYRNFFINITPSIDPSLGNFTLEEIIKYLDNYFRMKITQKEFYKSIYKAMNPIRNVMIKVVPYLIKKNIFFRLYLITMVKEDILQDFQSWYFPS